MLEVECWALDLFVLMANRCECVGTVVPIVISASSQIRAALFLFRKYFCKQCGAVS